jgi:formamidopyrimidine-DNA glycosylase
MPELPEVTTTVKGLNQVLPNLTIVDVWTDYHVNTKNKRKDTIKNRDYFSHFTKEVVNEKVLHAERRAKNILIHLSGNKTILIHMKMTGHLLFGKYKKIESEKQMWVATEKGLLQDPFNQFLHLVFTFSNGTHLAFSDMRKFAKVTLFETDKRAEVIDLKHLGPEPLENLSLKVFTSQLLQKPRGKIKTVLMDQSILAGIGNIYSDEILWESGVHPERVVREITEIEMKKMWHATQKILTAGIELGGDSMSDYRNIHGERGGFQNSHKAYRRTKQPCLKKGCEGIIARKIIGGRSAHFCTVHQK